MKLTYEAWVKQALDGDITDELDLQTNRLLHSRLADPDYFATDRKVRLLEGELKIRDNAWYDHIFRDW